MIDTIKSYLSIIDRWEITKYDIEGNSFRFLAELLFHDKSKLIVKEYYFESELKRKYSYHWMNKENLLISRWDNAEHWKDIPTFPHHVHHKTLFNVKPSRIITLQDVLEFILIRIKENAKNK